MPEPFSSQLSRQIADLEKDPEASPGFVASLRPLLRDALELEEQMRERAMLGGTEWTCPPRREDETGAQP